MRVEPGIDVFATRPALGSRTSSGARAVAHQASPRSRRWLGSLACFLLLMAVPGGLIAGRRAVVDAMPFMARPYAAIGLPVNLRGLEITSLSTRLEEQGGGRVLLVEGDVANVSAARVSVPALTLALRGANGVVLYSWTAASPRPQLDAADRMTFRTRLVSPPEGARDVHVAFK